MTQFIKKYLILAVASLAGAGIYSLPPLLLRGPLFKEILPVEDIFASSLVIHVNLSVLVWMLAVAGMLWSQFYKEKLHIFYQSAFIAAACGMFFILISPLTGNLNPLKNNYIPVLQNPIFFLGLGIFASAILLKTILTIINFRQFFAQPLAFGLLTASIITIIAFICFLISAINAPIFDLANPTYFYETIFWGGGHILQASYTCLLVIVWFMLLDAGGYKNPLPRNFLYMLFAANLLLSLPTPFFYLFTNHHELFARHMRECLGLLPIITGFAALYSVTFKLRSTSLPKISQPITPFLTLSILLFFYGGILAYMITGANVTIPAHYHGSIVGITLAFMGIVYYFMDKTGLKAPTGLAAKTQPYIYGIGQAMHITGLAIMGGYGALRKDAASSQTIDTIFGKTLFFTGGTLAIIGGLMFVILALNGILRKPKKA